VRFRIYFIALILLVAVGCRKESFFEGKATLKFSTDTVFFDTVFTTVGSLTERVKIYNPHDKTVKINSIFVSNTTGSNFKLNVDGFRGKQINDVSIAANDSMFVFVEVTVNPNGGNSPLVIEEQLIVETEQNEQQIDLVAWGQDAYFYPSIAFGDGDGDGLGDEWSLPVDKPIVFYGYSLVDTGSVLNIPCGARVHFHANSGLIVGHEASLKVIGCIENPVIIQGDRLEDYFSDVPGQWGQLVGGIYLTQTSIDNEIRNAIIKNGTVGVTVDSNTNDNPSLILENTQILNMSFIGILGQDARIEASNTVVANCGDHAVSLRYGGNYVFDHCTFANYWSGNPRSKATLHLNNFFEFENSVRARDFKGTFTNTIIHGSLENELFLDEDDGAPFEYYIDHCIIKQDTPSLDDPTYFNSIILNPSSPVVDGVSRHPLFDDFNKDYRLYEQSNAVDKGVTSSFLLDIEGITRDAFPDIGAYEYRP